MSAAAPWSVKGIDPKAREIAKDLARRSGLTLGDWLNQRILDESGDDDAVEESPVATEEFGNLKDILGRLSEQVDTSERRSTLAISGIDQRVFAVLSRLETAEREQVAVAARFEGALDEVKADQAKTAERLAKAEENAAHPRSIEALRALEAALGKVASHLYDSETRTRETLAEVKADLGTLNERVNGLDEADLGPSQVMIDGVVSRIVQRLEEAEARTSGAIQGLETSVAQFDARLNAAEARGEAPEQRLEQLAADLTRNFETARAEMAESLEAAADQRFIAMEQSVGRMTEQMQVSERRSTQAMERMGKEVLKVAQALGNRMEGVESRSAQALGRVSGDITRIADVMEGRLRKADQVQAESLEKLGTEIARITERLAERISSAERRSAQAIDDVGEQVSRVTERLTQRSERTSSELSERIRQSEERTARLLDEARDKIDQRLSGTEKRITEQVSQPPPAPAPPPQLQPDLSSLFADSDLPPGPFGSNAFGPGPVARRGDAPAGFVPPVETLPPEPVEDTPLDAEDFDAAQMFDAFTEEAEDSAPAEPDAPSAEDDAVAAAPAAPVSTKDLIAQARAAARAAAEGGEAGVVKGGLFSGLGLGSKKPKKASSRLRTGLKVSAAAAAISVSAAGLVLYSAQRVNPPSKPVAGKDGAQIATLKSDATAAGASATPQIALALAPQIQASSSPAQPAASSLYTDAVKRIEAKDKSGVDVLKQAANLGYAPAQFYLAKLYEAGDAGLTKDVAQARNWTERAAENGDRKAMHNLALYYFEGTGGPKNTTLAAQWFRRAAEMGLVDSQYNLARLYEGGFGVSQNPAEAYKWYVIASRAGDGESKAAAEKLKRLLSPQAQKTAEAAALAFQPDTSGAAMASAGGSAGG